MGSGALRSFGTVLRLVLTVLAAGFLALAAREASPQAGVAAPAVRYQLTDLGTLGGLTSSAYAINAVGQVVGVADVRPSDSRVYHARFSGRPAGRTAISLTRRCAISVRSEG